LAVLAEGQNLDAELMRAAMTEIMGGEADPAQIGGFLMALRVKGETPEEIAAAAEVMREFAARVEIDTEGLTDIVGTGGDGASLFNVSTASAFVAAAAGVRVAKHGNRSVSSKSGAADVLEAAGCRLDLAPEQVARLIDELGVGFLFAPQHHAAMKHAIGPRKSLGLRTLFNLLGPLTNPALAPNQVLGVFSAELVRPMAEVMRPWAHVT
jgi:anthranilate phosphoribosyltransferase